MRILCFAKKSGGKKWPCRIDIVLKKENLQFLLITSPVWLWGLAISLNGGEGSLIILIQTDECKTKRSEVKYAFDTISFDYNQGLPGPGVGPRQTPPGVGPASAGRGLKIFSGVKPRRGRGRKISGGGRPRRGRGCRGLAPALHIRKNILKYCKIKVYSKNIYYGWSGLKNPTSVRDKGFFKHHWFVVFSDMNYK